MKAARYLSMLLLSLLAACNLNSARQEGSGRLPTAPVPATGTPADAGPTADATARTIDLAHHPLYWFAPLPPMATSSGRPYIGSVDFMDLFTPGAPWEEAAGQLQVFKLYGEWVAYTATDAQLRTAVGDLRRRGLALAVEEGPLNATAGCGQGVESFAGADEGRLVAERIKAAGGEIDVLAMDEPFFYGHIYDGPNACRLPVEEIALQVDEYLRVMRSEFPDMILGDTEPLAGEAGSPEYKNWLDTFYSVNGYYPAFLHMDIDWSRATWPEEVKAIEDYGRSLGVPVGIIYTGNFQDQTDEAWISIAGERVKRYELQTGGQPDHVLFQSWNDKPDHALPEGEAYTFTNFINAYFADKAALGFRESGHGANLAFNKDVQASAVEALHPPEEAVDGDPGTWWSAGDGPVQWIEVDLGAPHDILELRLIPSQYPAGATTHRVLGKGSGTNDQLVEVTTFTGNTEDSQVLSFTPPEPLQGIQVIRIETTASPSWVAWREIEVIDAGQ